MSSRSGQESPVLPSFQPLYTLRKLLREPIVTLAIVLVLSLGIGANILMFLIYDHVVLRPLPYPALDRLVALWETNTSQGVRQGAVSIPNFLDWQAAARSFEGMAAIQRLPLTFGIPGRPPEIVTAARTSHELFFLTGARLALESGLGSDDTVVISNSLWQRFFGGDRGILGQAVEIDGRPATLAGVLAPGQEFPRGTEVWVSTRWNADPGQRGSRSLMVIGKLLAGTSPATAQGEMTSLAARLAAAHPEANAQAGAAVHLLREDLSANFKSTAGLIFGALGLSLLVVCINVGNLMQVRTSARQKEFGMRVVLGARQQDLIGQTAFELLVLSVAGTCGAILVAASGRRLLAASSLGQTLRMESIAFDHRLWLFSGLLAAAVALCLAVAPSMQLVGLRFGAPGSGGEHLVHGHERRSAGLLRFLTVLQIAISLPLVVGAFLLLTNLHAIEKLDMGFQREQVHSWRLAFPRHGAALASRPQIVAEALERVAALPGVERCGLVSTLPFSGTRAAGSFLILDRPAPGPGDEPTSDFRVVAGDYFEALAIPLRSGRFFTATDGPFSPGVAIVNRALAERYWPNEDPLGKRIRVGAPEEQALFGSSIEREIVGVVGNVQHEGLSGERSPELYLPYGQNPTSNLFLAAKIPGANPAGPAASVPGAFLGGRSDLQIAGYQPMQDLISRSLGHPELQSAMVAFLGMLSVFLVCLTIYAIVSSFVTSRYRSLAIRMAMGAKTADVAWLVGSQGAGLTAAGLGAGALATWSMSKLLAHNVTLVSPNLALSLLFGFALIAVLVALAIVAPIRHALRIQPAELLRNG